MRNLFSKLSENITKHNNKLPKDGDLTQKKASKLSLTVVALLILVVGISFAYLVAQISGGAIGNVDITADKTDNFSFEVTKDISLTMNQFNFANGAGNLSDSAIARAKLLANSTNKSATYNYYVYFYITSNNYVYTTSDEKPEIVLSITDPTGASVTSVKGLNYVTATNADGTTVDGFDITTKSGLFNIASLYEITSSSSTNATVQDWTFTVTLVNLATNQLANKGKVISAEVKIQREEMATLASYVTSLYTTDGENGLYLHDANLENGANDGSYRYSGDDENHPAYYSCTYDGVDVYNYEYYEYNMSLKDDCSTVYKATNQDGTINYLDRTFENYYYNTVSVSWNEENSKCVTADGSEEVYDWYDNLVSDSSFCNGIAYQWKDIDWYYVGIENLGAGVETLYSEEKDAVNNFVCFGSDAVTCPTDNLYRIIGVFDDRVKLIKYDYANSNLLGTNGDYSGTDTFEYSSYYKGNLTKIDVYYWNRANSSTAYNTTGYYNVWSYSALNTVNLNTNYINNIGSEWANKIATTVWKVGGNTYANIVQSISPTIYQNEIVNPNSDVETEYSAKIGLLYASDYSFAASPENWTTTLYDYDNETNRNNNWMFMGLYEWTIARRSDRTTFAFFVHSDGSMVNYEVNNDNYSVRPVFYLESSIPITGGTGSKDNPYRIT